jgi:hypothetical protein
MQLDDVPAAPGTFGGPTDDAYPPPPSAEDEDFSGLSADELLRHANWKARKEGLEGVTANPLEGRPLFCSMLPRLAKESNAAVLEALLEAANATVALSDSDHAQIADALVKVVVEKGIVGRPKAQQSSGVLLTALVEAGQHTVVISAIIGGFTHKTPKNRLACVQACTLILADFGPAPFTLKTLLKSLVPLFNDANAAVRKEAQNLCVQCYRFTGQGIMAFLSDLRDVQQQELAKAFEDITPGSCVPTRFVKGMAPPVAAASSKTAGPALGAAGADMFDLVDELPVLSRLPRAFFAAALDKNSKWQDRAALIKDTLQPLIAVPKIRQSDDYTELVKMIKELLIDAQFPLVLIGIKFVQDLSRSLRAPLAQYSRHIIPALFDKFKDKKASLLEAIHVTLDSLLTHRCVSMDMLNDEIELGASSKIPNQRHAIVLWLIHVLESGVVDPSVSLVRIAKNTAMHLKLVNDEKCEIRESALLLVGRLHAALGERALAQVLQGLDDKQRVKTGITPGGSPASADSCDVSPTSQKQGLLSVPAVLGGGKLVLGMSSGALKKGSSGALLPSTTASARSSDAQKSGKLPPGPSLATDDAVALEAGMPQKEEAFSKMSAILAADGDSILPMLAAKEWKSRADAAARLGECIQSAWDGPTADAHMESLLVLLKFYPGWKESIFQVFNAMCSAVVDAAKVATTMSLRAAFSIIVNVTPRITDSKNKPFVRELLSCVTGFVGVKFVLKHCINLLNAAKTPKLTQDVLEFFVRLLFEYPDAPVETKMLLDFVKTTCFEQAVPMVKQAGLLLAAALRHRVGSKIDTLLADINPHIKTALEGEVDRFSPPSDVIARELRASAGSTAQQTSRPGSSAASAAPSSSSQIRAPAPEEDMPRVDLSVHLFALGKEVSNGKDWKARQIAVKRVEELLLAAHKNIHSNGVTDMLKALRTRFDDSNKNVVVDSLKVIVLLIESAGSAACRPGLKAILPAVLALLGDQKQSLRDEAYTVAQLGVLALGMENVLPMVIKPLSSDSLQCRQLTIEVLEKGFAANTAPLKASFLLPVVVPLVRLLMDRTVDVRSIADRLVAVIMPFVGPDAFQKAAMDLKPAEQQQVRPALERHFATIIPSPGIGAVAQQQAGGVRESIVLGAPAASSAPRATITLGVNQPQSLSSAVTGGPSKLAGATTSPQPPPPNSAQTKVAALAENDVPLTVEEICLGLRSASSMGALRMCGDFMKRFRRNEDCGTLDVITSMIERLYQNIQQLDVDLALGLIGCLNVMFESSRSASRCNSDKLYPMFGMVFDCLLSEQFSTNESVIKALNNMALRMLVGCPIDDVFGALMARLDTYSTKYLETATKMDHKYLQVVVKCLMRLEAENVRIENIILACHDYLLQHPPSAFRTRDDLPIRTIKTILQNIAKQHGRELLELADRYVGNQNLVSHFIRACLESKEREARRAAELVSSSDAGETTPGEQQLARRTQHHVDPTLGSGGAGVQASASQPPSLSNVAPNVHAARLPADDGKPVAQIFAKIRNHATSVTGCEELYEYLKVSPGCPEFVLQLNRCSDAFRSYIKRRLERAAQEDTQRPENFAFPAVLQSIA